MRIENWYLYMQDRRYDLIWLAVLVSLTAILAVPLYFIAFA